MSVLSVNIASSLRFHNDDSRLRHLLWILIHNTHNRKGPHHQTAVDDIDGLAANIDLSQIAQLTLQLAQSMSNASVWEKTGECIQVLRSLGVQLDVHFDATADRLTALCSTKVEDYEQRVQRALMTQIKSCIRGAVLDAAQYCFSAGEFVLADNFIGAIRDSKNKEMLYFLAEMSVYQQDFEKLEALHADLKTILECVADETPSARFAVIEGLLKMHQQSYQTATQTLLKINASDQLFTQSCNIATFDDIALWIGLCSLTTRDAWSTLKPMVRLESSAYRDALDNLPLLRQLLMAFDNCNFADFGHGLSRLTPSLHLDPLLAPMLPDMLAAIKGNLIMQYFRPFECLRISTLHAALGIPQNEVEELLRRLILSDRLDAKIDKIDQTLLRSDRSNDSKLATAAISLVQNFCSVSDNVAWNECDAPFGSQRQRLRGKRLADVHRR